VYNSLMALNPTTLKASIKTAVYNALKANFQSDTDQGDGYTATADAKWLLLADAIAAAAAPIVTAITTEAQVSPGQSVTGTSPSGPVTGVTTTPGTIV
jgi:kynureninase